MLIFLPIFLVPFPSKIEFLPVMGSDLRKSSRPLIWVDSFKVNSTLISDFEFRNISYFPAVIYVGFFEMGFTFVLWLKAMQLTSSNDKISNFVYLSPFLALIFIRFILNENIYYTTFIGLVFIVSGIGIQQFKLKRTKNEKKRQGN